MWLLENPWPPAFAAITIAIVLVVAWSRTGRQPLLIGSIVCAVCGVFAFIVDVAVVTEAEIVEQRVHDFVSAVESGDAEESISYISELLESERAQIYFAMERFSVDPGVRISDMIAQTRLNDTLATTEFRANGRVTAKDYDYNVHAATRWKLSWQKEGDEWKIAEIQRLDPLTGATISLMSRVNVR
ncbi:hypothetical protein [Calycomorphotria hydatis]|uniref:DUF4440 domain-containing protein n=1 Tax=Calycomorphotria hydatis TaxID=2528027 RepID=A0A517T8V7_9PLAN|nr:hypothetical protein [Calycomorphotria hydatis]QDT64814.1 hypothetical protein V22_20570 [Calycomorphotria hydatis]